MSLNADDCSRHFAACFAFASAFAALSAWGHEHKTNAKAKATTQGRRKIERRLVSHLPWIPSLMAPLMTSITAFPLFG